MLCRDFLRRILTEMFLELLLYCVPCIGSQMINPRKLFFMLFERIPNIELHCSTLAILKRYVSLFYRFPALGFWLLFKAFVSFQLLLCNRSVEFLHLLLIRNPEVIHTLLIFLSNFTTFNNSLHGLFISWRHLLWLLQCAFINFNNFWLITIILHKNFIGRILLTNTICCITILFYDFFSHILFIVLLEYFFIFLPKLRL